MDESLYTSQKDESRENIRPRKACFEDDIQMTVKRTVTQPLPITDFSDHAERRKTYVSSEPPDETFAEQGIEQVDGYYKTVDKIAKPVIVNQPTPQPISVSPVASTNVTTGTTPSTPLYQATEDEVPVRPQVNAQLQAKIDAQKAVAEAQRLAALQEAERLQAIEDKKAAEAKRKKLADEAFYKAGVDERSVDEPFYKAGVDAEAADKAIAGHELALKDAEQQQAQIVAEKASVIIAQVSEALKRETNEENIKLLEQQKADAEAVKSAAEKVINGDDIFDKIARWVIKTMNL